MIGTTLGQYRILEEIGRGGMAVVYKAYQPALDRTVAMKVLPPELSLDYQFVQRFAREARSATKLTHPHIVTIHELDQTEGNHFIVMEYVDGPSMADLLMREGALPPPQAAQILAQVGSALDYAHRQAFVHRDIKPANILLGPGETAKLTDFGIVKAADGTSLTRTGTLLGTPAYMSPEQARGTTITRSTDVYSLGVVAYEMLSGRVPFTGDTAAVLHAHAYDPPDLAVLPPVVQQVVGGALEKDPEKRFQSAGAFSHALTGAVAGAVAGGPAGGPRVGSPDQSAAPSRGLPGWLWGALGVSAALLVTAVILAVWLVNRWGVLRTETPDLAEGTEIHQAAAVREMEAREAAPVNPAAAMVITSTVPPRETSSPTPVPTETPTVTPPPTTSSDPTPLPEPLSPTPTPPPTEAPTPTARPQLLVEDAEGYSSAASLNAAYQINHCWDANEGQLTLAGPPHVGGGTQAIAFWFNIRQAPPNDYSGFERFLPAPQDWSGHSHLCLWTESDGSINEVVIQFREKGGEVWKHHLPLSPGAHDSCIPLVEGVFVHADWSAGRKDRIDLSAVDYYGIYVRRSQPGSGTIYVDNLRVVSQ